MSSFPQSFVSTVSHWQASNRGPTSLYNYNKDTKVPERASCVIIGAGMTGASLAYQLTTQQPILEGQGKVVILEAKDVASGATGRNGGHVRPASFMAYPGLVLAMDKGGAGHTPEEAVTILEDEEENMRLVEDIVERKGLNNGAYGGVEWVMGESIMVFRNEAEVNTNREALKAYNNAREKYGYSKAKGITFVDNAGEARKFTRMDQAAGYAITPAGMVHPHKLATALLRLALATDRCELHSWTPVSTFERSGNGWIVHTSKGDISTDKIVLASNAHTRHLWDTPDLPFNQLITANRGHCCHVTPPTNYSGSGSVERSVAWGGTYLRSVANGGWVMGCGAQTIREYKLAPPEEVYDVVDDSIITTGVEDHLCKTLSQTYQDWKESPGEGTRRVWSGIIGYSRDKLPFVGPVPGNSGLFAAVAFHGHGMSRILCCTRALATQMNDPQLQWDKRLPKSFEISAERVKRALSAPPIYAQAPNQAGLGLPKEEMMSSENK